MSESSDQKFTMDGRLSSDVRPTTAVKVTNHPLSGKINPNPTGIDEAEYLIEEYLSPRKLKALTGVDDLEEVRFLEMKVDASETSLGNFGSLLPNLCQLKLSNSIIFSVRDLGSCFTSLRVLWLSRCNLDDLDGICAMINLKELYLAYNEICDLSPISMMECLEILDLEGNNISDITQVEFLSLVRTLKNLTLEGNPICVTPNPEATTKEYDYRSTALRLLPQLELLDDLPASTSADDGHAAMFDADWNYLKELESSGTIVSLEGEDSDGDSSSYAEMQSPLRPSTGYRPGTALRPTSAMKRLNTGRMIGTQAPSVRPKTSANTARPGSSDSGNFTEQSTDASDLTTGSLLCGNLAQALRNRRSPKTTAARRLSQKLTGSNTSQTTHSQTPSMTSQNDRDVIAKHAQTETHKQDGDSEELLNDLNLWRLHHSSIQDKLKESRAPNVLKIDHEGDNDNISEGSDDADFPLVSQDMTREDEDLGFVSRQDSQAASDDEDEDGFKSPSLRVSSMSGGSAPSTPNTYNNASLANHKAALPKFTKSLSMEAPVGQMPQVRPPLGSPKERDNIRRIQRLRRRTAAATTIESPILLPGDALTNRRELASISIKHPQPK